MICECTCSSSSIIGPDLQFSKKYSLLLNNTFSAAQDVLSHINCVFALHRSHAVIGLLHQISCCRHSCLTSGQSSSISHDSYCASVLPIWHINSLVVVNQEYSRVCYVHVFTCTNTFCHRTTIQGWPESEHPQFWFTTQILM